MKIAPGPSVSVGQRFFGDLSTSCFGLWSAERGNNIKFPSLISAFSNIDPMYRHRLASSSQQENLASSYCETHKKLTTFFAILLAAICICKTHVAKLVRSHRRRKIINLKFFQTQHNRRIQFACNLILIRVKWKKNRILV